MDKIYKIKTLLLFYLKIILKAEKKTYISCNMNFKKDVQQYFVGT